MPKRNYKYLSQRQFAKLAKVSQQAISRGLRAGIVKQTEFDGINPEDAVNKTYIENNRNTNSGNKRDVAFSKKAVRALSKDGVLEKLVNILEGGQFQGKVRAGQSLPVARTETQNGQSSSVVGMKEQADQSSPVVETEAEVDQSSPVAGIETDTDRETALAWVDNKKNQSVINHAKGIKANLEVAEMMGELIRRQDVISFWKRVIGAMQNNVLTIDERLAERIAAICGTSDPDIVSAVRKKISEELIIAMTMVKKEADEFSLGLV